MRWCFRQTKRSGANSAPDPSLLILMSVCWSESDSAVEAEVLHLLDRDGTRASASGN